MSPESPPVLAHAMRHMANTMRGLKPKTREMMRKIAASMEAELGALPPGVVVPPDVLRGATTILEETFLHMAAEVRGLS